MRTQNLKKARIHIYFATVQLPNRKLSEIESAHDVIDIDIGPNEQVVQVDLIESPVYNRAKAPAAKIDEWSDLVPATLREREVNVKDRTMSNFRARVATIEEIDFSDSEDDLLLLEELTDALLINKKE